ncbi:MAG: 16S rRNA (adenine(1518)-N(6)/adenine(1519)-N(6))-dimethyltransferase RsmA [Gemmatimonadota bacterium]
MHRARKSLGQNFLVDPNIRRRIVHALRPASDDEVLEIGPGTGAITRLLAGNVRRLVAVELDGRLASDLDAEFHDETGIAILNRDILDLDLADVCTDTDSLKVVGNIPYNITTPILFRLLERRWRPAVILIMVQKEVADRIVADAGTAAFGALSVGVRTVATVERLFNVRRTAFRPVPNVDSTVLRITPIRPFPLSESREADLRQLTQTAFGWRRKQLQRTLRDAPAYRLAPDQVERLQNDSGFDLRRRIETFDPEDITRLADLLRRLGRPLAPGPPR